VREILFSCLDCYGCHSIVRYLHIRDIFKRPPRGVILQYDTIYYKLIQVHSKGIEKYDTRIVEGRTYWKKKTSAPLTRNT